MFFFLFLQFGCSPLGKLLAREKDDGGALHRGMDGHLQLVDVVVTNLVCFTPNVGRYFPSDIAEKEENLWWTGHHPSSRNCSTEQELLRDSVAEK